MNYLQNGHTLQIYANFKKGGELMQLRKDLYEEKTRIKGLLSKINVVLGELEQDSAKIKVVLKNGAYVQTYISEQGSALDSFHYLPVSQLDRAINIVKQEYYRNLKKCLEKKERQVNACIAHLGNDYVYEVYEKLGKGKQQLVEPIEMTDEEYRKRWESVEYTSKEFGDDDIEIYTEKGERVRSKSEKIIADKLYKENIAYRYECPIIIGNMITVYPDFIILDEKNRKDIILEHFGMMDNEVYAGSTVSKISLYAGEGYVMGDNLFFTMETATRPLDSRVLDGIIAQIKNG